MNVNIYIYLFIILINFRGAFTFEEILHKGSNSDSLANLECAEKLVQFDDVCNIQFTSGTTGNPKGVMLSHHNLVNNGYFLSRRFGYTEKVYI